MFVNNVTDYGCWFKCSMFNNAAYSYIIIFYSWWSMFVGNQKFPDSWERKFRW